MWRNLLVIISDVAIDLNDQNEFSFENKDIITTYLTEELYKKIIKNDKYHYWFLYNEAVSTTEEMRDLIKANNILMGYEE